MYAKKIDNSKQEHLYNTNISTMVFILQSNMFKTTCQLFIWNEPKYYYIPMPVFACCPLVHYTIYVKCFKCLNGITKQTWILSLRLYSALMWESRLCLGIGFAGLPHFGLWCPLWDEFESWWLTSLSGDDGASNDNWECKNLYNSTIE